MAREGPAPFVEVTLAMHDLGARPSRIQHHTEAKRPSGEREDALAHKLGQIWCRLTCTKSSGCLGKQGREARRRRRWCCGLVTTVILSIIVIAFLAVTLSHHRKRVVAPQPQSQPQPAPQPSFWVNLTGWPPIPTGLSTIAAPDLTASNAGCVFLSTLWSCSLPKELQKSDPLDRHSRPSFGLEISHLLTASSNNGSRPRRRSNVARRTLLDHMLGRRDGPNAIAFAPTPDPPNLEDQRFIGNTTDQVVSPLKEGEESPFALALVLHRWNGSTEDSARPSVDSSHVRRDSDEFPDVRALIPPPAMDSDGVPRDANLLPESVSQRLRLYDRGLETEHYGFYVYYDRSIFLKSTALLNGSEIAPGEVPDDLEGGSTRRAARVRCTWAQTRFLVQIWTRTVNGTTLLPGSTGSSGASSDEAPHPHRLPYPATITLDRHGGDITRKMIYCYGLDDRGTVARNLAKVQIEDRAFGGDLVGGGQGPLGKNRVTIGQGGWGGIDGGTGGCACRWKNFVIQT